MVTTPACRLVDLLVTNYLTSGEGCIDSIFWIKVTVKDHVLVQKERFTVVEQNSWDVVTTTRFNRREMMDFVIIVFHRIGRYYTYSIALGLFFCSNIAVAFSPNVIAFGVFRFLVGMANIGSYIVAFLMGT